MTEIKKKRGLNIIKNKNAKEVKNEQETEKQETYN
jgi:hypothetical protein